MQPDTVLDMRETLTHKSKRNTAIDDQTTRNVLENLPRTDKSEQEFKDKEMLPCDMRRIKEEKEIIFRLKTLLVIFFILCLGFIFVGMFGPDILESIVQDKIETDFTLSRRNKDILGSTLNRWNITESSRFTFFNFTNPTDFFEGFKHPIFAELNDTLKFKHRVKVIAPSWSEDKSTVNFGVEHHLEPDFEAENAAGISNETILEKQITIPNIPSISLWQSLKQLKQARVAQMKLGDVKDRWDSHGSFHNEILANLMMNFRDDDPKYLESVIATI